jgi:hypothetical protein
MTKVKLLLDDSKHDFLPQENTVFDFTNIFECWLQGKCTTEYLYQYCSQEIAERFLTELERRKNEHQSKTDSFAE